MAEHDEVEGGGSPDFYGATATCRRLGDGSVDAVIGILEVHRRKFGRNV
jgi:hypothetical protein